MTDVDPLRLEASVLRILLNFPDRRTDKRSWHGHIPFARWLIGMTRPACIVELGVHKGDSLCAFCEAVKWFGLNTTVHGVDHWQGDAHAGFYSSDVFGDLKRYVDAHYADRAQLHCKSFDDAAGDFADGTIDLLHIDGCHHYDAVAHDFATWLPKLSVRGVVLLHDIAERGHDFEVWRFWDELTARYPSFQMTHSHGLGLVAVGSQPPPPIAALTALEPAQTREASALFERIGTLVAAGPEHQQLRAEIRALEARNDMQCAVQDSLAKVLEETSSKRAQAERAHADAEVRLREEQQKTAQLETKLRDRDTVENWARDLEDQLKSVYASTSWRVTAPLRAATRFARAPIGQVQHSVAQRLAPYPRVYRAVRRVYRMSRLAIGLPGHRQPVSAQGAASEVEMTEAEARAAWRAEAQAVFARFCASSDRLVLPTAESPHVSIVLVLYNQAELTYQALDALARLDETSYEVIVVDNASTDATETLLARLDGAHIVRNAENVGFLHAVNQAAELAVGTHLVLLNNDAVLRPGSLAAACDVLDSHPDVGAVGGRIVLPNGRLQEAGSIIWRDGSCLGYARGRPAEASEALFRRDVDFCSGAFLVTRRALFAELGGFDPAYAPAYYEETDYCVRLWRAGWRVVYEPTAVIDHLEFGSSQSSAEAMELQRRNRQTFEAKHAGWLAGQRAANDAHVVHARDRASARVLFVEDRIPHPTLGSGYPRACTILADLHALGFSVTLYPAVFPDAAHTEATDALAPEIEVARGWGDALGEFLAERVGYYTVLLVSRPHNMKRVRECYQRKPQLFENLSIIYDAEALFARRDIQAAALRGRPYTAAQAEAMVTRELDLARPAETVITVSEHEAAEFRRRGFPDVHVIGHAIAPQPTETPFEARAGFLFVGRLNDENSPNVDSLHWFCTEVLPRLRARLDAEPQITVAGPAEAASLRDLRRHGVRLFGQVPDLQPLYAAARVFVAPTRFAAGVPHKVHEAAAYGVPCVVTPVLREQLGWTHERELLVGDTADAFAAACVQAHEHADVWARLRANALTRLRDECDPAHTRTTLTRLLAHRHDRPADAAS